MSNITTKPKTETIVKVSDDILSSLVIKGDLSGLTSPQKTEYYKKYCESLGLNPLTQPFELINFQGKQRLYAKKDATEQLRKLYNISIIEITEKKIEDILIVSCKVTDGQRTDLATGAVTLGNLKGDALCNAYMKAETKAKRRATLSICGLGILDETEIETLGDAIELKGKDILRDYTKEIESLKTEAAIKTYYNQLTDSEKKDLTGALKQRKEEILSWIKLEKEGRIKEIINNKKPVIEDIPFEDDGTGDMKPLFDQREGLE